MKMPLPQDNISSLSGEIDKCTQLGNEELNNGEQDKALQAFAAAYEKSVLLEEKYTERACAFNLGAVYIAMGQPQRGLELLLRALPSKDDENEQQSNSDLYYNLGLGYDQMRRYDEAIRYYEQAIEAYGKDGGNPLIEGEALTKLAFTYTNLNKSSQAAKCHGQAAMMYERAEDVERQALALNFQATCLLESRRVPECEDALDRCREVCGDMKEGEVLGKLYNDLGMTYTSAKAFSKAVECFELALPLTRGPNGDQKREAVLLQNLGAVYNSCGEYQRAISFHEAAAKLHNDLGNRQAQGHCFCNLAYAFSQVNDNDAAGEAFLHALQAAKDTGDKHGQWQAHEGLGAVHFRMGNPERAIASYKQALALLTRLKDPNSQAQERIVGKLTDALKYQLKVGDSPRHPGKERKITSSVEKRPVSSQSKNGSVAHHVDESITSESPRSDPGRDKKYSRTDSGKRKPKRYVKRERSFSDSTNQGSMHNVQTVARGIATYDSDADLSLFDAKKKRSKNNGLHPSSASTVATVERTPAKVNVSASVSDARGANTAFDEPDLAYKARREYHTSYVEEDGYDDVIPTSRGKAIESKEGGVQGRRKGGHPDVPSLEVNGQTSQQSSSETSALSSSDSGSSESESESESEGKAAVRKEYQKALNGTQTTTPNTTVKAGMPPTLPAPLVDSPMSTLDTSATSALDNTYMTPADVSRVTSGDNADLPVYAMSSKHKNAQRPAEPAKKGEKEEEETSGTEQDIDGTAFLVLHYGAMRSLVPRVGPRLRFWQAYLRLFPHKRKLAKHRQPQSSVGRRQSRSRRMTIRETTVQERTVTNRTVRFHNSPGVGGHRSSQNRLHDDATEDTSADSSSSENSDSETESDPDEHLYETVRTQGGRTMQFEGKPSADEQPKAHSTPRKTTPTKEAQPPSPARTVSRADREEALFQLAKQQSREAQEQAERDMQASRSQSRNESRTCVVM
ncbi:serine-rich adhesin for platelets-like [Branchiostoma lanceolatum]|uniref:serine-rich adhesin for platelets-like n=1 Tax=Branchiostoma lanceolatum TaxID=7740 RepID=UPI0034516738